MGKAKNKNKYGSPYGKGEVPKNGPRHGKSKASNNGSAGLERREHIAAAVAELISFVRDMPNFAEGVVLGHGGFRFSYGPEVEGSDFFKNLAQFVIGNVLLQGQSGESLEIAEAALGPMLFMFDEFDRSPVSFDSETNVLRFASPAETSALREEQKIIACIAPATSPSRSLAL